MSRRRATLSRTPLFFIADGHGSTRELRDAAGAVPAGVARFAYDAYGNPLGFDPAAALTDVLYSGQLFDNSTGLAYLRARYYDPSVGGFTRLDPFGGIGSNPQTFMAYAYAHLDPVNLVDPGGESALFDYALDVGRRIRSVLWTRYTIVGVFGGIAAYYTGKILLMLATMANSEPLPPGSLDKALDEGKTYWPDYPKMTKMINELETETTDIRGVPGPQVKVMPSWGILGEGASFWLDQNTLYVDHDAPEKDSLYLLLVIFAEYQHNFRGGGMSEQEAQAEFMRVRNMLPPHVRTPEIDKLSHEGTENE